MPRPGVGNPGNSGNPHPVGRRSPLQEKKDAEFVSEIWQVGRDLDELKEKLKPEPGKKVSARDVFAYLALTAMLPSHKDTALMKLADKILPDKIDFGGEGLKEIEDILRAAFSLKKNDSAANGNS